ncbi:MAG: EamA family transporter [Peptostreptococcaceae bacterium]|nr:EamA family transporter [Peptostreptococcaceae bacterium]
MNKYYLYIITAASLWGTIGIIVKVFYAAGFSPIQLVCFRTFIGGLLIFIYLITKDKSKLKIKLTDTWMFFGTGIISFAFFNVCYFIAVDKTGLSVASVLLYTAPGFVFVLSIIVFKEKITRVKMLALCLAFFGCLLVSGVLQKTDVSLDFSGIMIGILAGFGYGLYSIFGKIALSKYDPLTVTFYTFVFGFFGAMPFAKITEIPSMITSGTIALNIILLAVVITTVPFALYTKGLSKVEPSKASILATIEPVVATVLGMILFSEEMTFIKFLGITFVISASIIISLNPGFVNGGLNGYKIRQTDN